MTVPQSSGEALRMAQDIKAKLIALDAQFPGEAAIASSLAQLDYAIPYISQAGNVMERVDKLNFGFYGVRIIRDFDMELGREMSHLNKYLTDRFRPS